MERTSTMEVLFNLLLMCYDLYNRIIIEYDRKRKVRSEWSLNGRGWITIKL